MEVRKFRSSYILFLLVLFITACNPFGFSRGKAAEMIASEAQYKNPAFLNTDVGMLANAQGQAWQISRDDTVEAAAERARQDFYKRQPQLWAAEHLGFIKLHFEKPELGGRQMSMPSELYSQRLGVWYFKVRAEITEEGKKLWRSIGLPENDRALPLSVRAAPNITGLTDEDSNTKKAEFSYRWEPTPLGAALDPRTSEFGKLPPELQEVLKKPQFDLFGGSGTKTTNITDERKGVCYFRRFDDGWRIQNLSLL